MGHNFSNPASSTEAEMANVLLNPTMGLSGWIKLHEIQDAVCCPINNLNVAKCGHSTRCILCPAFTDRKNFFEEAKKESLKMEETIQGFLLDPQAAFCEPDLSLGETFLSFTKFKC